ncbi:PAIRED AMPHIPATHIC HELIX SIN3-LIKE PROTEIN-RELATED [Salix purpurea]|uniref:PAIRED AMPHIPATHIC HELIX SIN3-LIKE PROTEIN-RELATED n=1 Tax=Salix purpurea TaxID=77065 RepID=A0A9Q0VTR1_SALPP|nr:PAIRED AMPHIPATHIC HELIX SIN3-LIKE PROTEIN-RELATED [Salix purpurea]
METQRDYHGESRTYLKELRARFEGQPEKLGSFFRVMKDVMALTDELSGRIENVPDDVLARVKEILGGHCDLIHGFDLFLPPSHRFSLDDEDDTMEVEVEVEDKDMEEAAAVSAEKTMLSQNFIDQQTMSGGKAWDDHRGFSRFMRDSEATSGASLVPNSQDKDVNNGQEVIVQAGEQQQKQPEKIDQIGFEKDEVDRNFVKRAGRDAEKRCDRAVIKKLRKDGLCLFDKVRKRLSCDNTYYKFLKVIFYYTNRKIRKPEWKERIAVLIGKHPDLMDEFQRYVTDSENVQVSRKKDGEEDEGQKIETRGRKKRDKKKRKSLNKSNPELHLSRRKRCTPSYLYIRKRYRDPPKHDRILQPELQELNDRFLSVPSGTGAFFSRKIDEEEEILFECEDNRYEMDMLIGWFSSAVEYADELEKGIPDDEFRKWNRDIFLRCVERLYDDQGLDFLQIFNEDPQLALPVLKVRLEQKLKELKDYRDELREKWRCVYAKI